MINITHYRVDKLCLSRTYITLEERCEYNSTLCQAKSLREQGDLIRYSGKHHTKFWKQYPGAESPRVYFKFGGNHKYSWSKIDFTPSKLTDDWSDFLYLCGYIHGDANYKEPLPVWKHFTVSEIELAADIKAPMHNFIYVAPSIQTENTNYLSKGTRYLGAEKSPRRFAIYDKQKQLLEKKGIDIGHPLTRVEARLGGTGLTLAQLPNIKSPYSKLLVVPTAKLSKLDNNKATRAFVRHVNQGKTGQEAYRLLSPYQRKQIVKALQEHALHLGMSPNRWGKWLQGKTNELHHRFHDSAGSQCN